MTGSPVLDGAAHEKEVMLTTFGRKTGKPRRVTLWIATDGKTMFVRSGKGLVRDWPQNLMAGGEGKLHIAGQTVNVKSRHVTDPEEARAVSRLVRAKYGSMVKSSEGSEPLTDAERATFELIPV